MDLWISRTETNSCVSIGAELCQTVPMGKYEDIQRLKADRLVRMEAKNAAYRPTVGRPLAKDADKSLAKTKPWLALGMSRRTWFRRQKASEQ